VVPREKSISTLEYRRGKAVITVVLRFSGSALPCLAVVDMRASFFSARPRENRGMLLILWFPRPVPVWEQHVVATSRVQYGTGWIVAPMAGVVLKEWWSLALRRHEGVRS